MRTRLAVAVGTLAVAGVVTATLSVAACSPSSPTVSSGNAGTSSSPAFPSTGTSAPTGAAPTTGPTSELATGPRTGVTYGLGSLVPLWPFTTAAQAHAWQVSYQSGGHQPWHLDPGQTALAFARGHLGYADVDRVTSLAVRGGDARVGVGWNAPESANHSVAVLHLARFGSGADAPWVVVGSDDTRLTLDTPRYGATVSSPLTVGGRITGVDESLRVVLLAPATATPLATVAGLPAGGENTPWSTTLRFTAPAGSLLTVAVSTGGHLKAVESFAITAVRAG